MTDQPQSEEAWVPDGHGLPDLAREFAAEHDARVHLRLTSPGRRSARGACGGGLGELWTGRPAEVNCPACLEVADVHDRHVTAIILGRFADLMAIINEEPE